MFKIEIKWFRTHTYTTLREYARGTGSRKDLLENFNQPSHFFFYSTLLTTRTMCHVADQNAAIKRILDLTCIVMDHAHSYNTINLQL